MLAEEIAKLEGENQRLKVLVNQMMGNIPKPKNCQNCKYYVRHYGKRNDVYYPLHFGHCICGVPIKERRGKKNPTLNDTCLCFKEGFNH